MKRLGYFLNKRLSDSKEHNKLYEGLIYTYSLESTKTMLSFYKNKYKS